MAIIAVTFYFDDQDVDVTRTVDRIIETYECVAMSEPKDVTDEFDMEHYPDTVGRLTDKEVEDELRGNPPTQL